MEETLIEVAAVLIGAQERVRRGGVKDTDQSFKREE